MRSLDDNASKASGLFTLRRYRAGELSEDARTALEKELAGNPVLRAKLDSLAHEQHDFETDVSFERFAGGVERARRVPAHKRPTTPRFARRGLIVGGAGALAAAAALAIVLRPTDAINRIKGGDDNPIVVRVAAADGSHQREASAQLAEHLAPGERARIGVAAPAPLELIALSVDENGIVTPLYPERGEGLKIKPSREPVYLPDSVEFTGKGRERLLVFLGDRALSVEAVVASVRDAFARNGGDVALFQAPEPEGVAVSSFLFEKP